MSDVLFTLKKKLVFYQVKEKQQTNKLTANSMYVILKTRNVPDEGFVFLCKSSTRRARVEKYGRMEVYAVFVGQYPVLLIAFLKIVFFFSY